MIVYDYEVFKHNTLLGALDIETGKITQLWDIPAIKKYIHDNVGQVWIGYNSDHYDKILSHGILTGKLTSELRVFNCSNDIIRTQDDDSPLFNVLRKYDIGDYYSSPILSYDLLGDGAFFSLKQLEGFMGMDIVESVVPFDLDRPLTDDEKEDVAKYNRADLYGTLERFKQRKNTFRTKMMLVKEFKLPVGYMCKSNAKLTETILLSQNKGVNTRLHKHFELCDLPADWSVPEIKQIYDFFCEALKELEIHKWDTKKCDKTKLSMELEVLGLVHTYALGGVHAGTKNYMCAPKDGKKVIWVDVGSLYPSILTKWDLLSRQIDKRGVDAFTNMVQTRLTLKEKVHDPSITKEEKATMKDQIARYKLILNTTSGCMKDRFKKIYDPEFNTKMCMLGQIALTDLMFRLKNGIKNKPKKSWALAEGETSDTSEPFILVNSNTDGIALEVSDPYVEEQMDAICAGWEKDWRFSLEKTVADNLYQKDVNNYVFRDGGGSIKAKGAYVTKYKDDNEQDTLAILAKAVVYYFLDGKDIRDTILNPDNPATDYQMIKKLGGMYDTPTWKTEDRGDIEVQKVNRIFPSTNTNNGGLYKHKKSKDIGVLDKVEGTPEHLIVYNEDIRGKKISEIKDIDYEWYINEAQKRINDFLGIKPERKARKKKGA